MIECSYCVIVRHDDMFYCLKTLIVVVTCYCSKELVSTSVL